MSTQTDILIIGGGLAGPALALALASGGLRSKILDAAPQDVLADPDFDGRSYALSLSTRRMLEQLGIWQVVADKAEAIRDIRVSDGQAGQGAAPFFLHFDHNEITEGPMGHLLEDRYLRQALADAVSAEPLIDIAYDARVTGQSISPGGVEVTLADGTTYAGRLLVGADGRASQTAERAGITRTGWGYGQTSLVAALSVEKPHNGVAQQMFFPEGPLAVLPLTGNRVSIVWTESDARARDIMAMDESGYLEVLRPRFGSYLGQIGLIGKRYCYPLGLSLANRIIAERMALVGDAAHGIHPLAGQGLNLGLRDVAAFAEVVITAQRRGEDIGAADVLDRYRQWRGFDIAMLATATDGINRIFSNDNPLMRLGRTLGLGAINAMPEARRRFIREAAGLTGDLPRLLQGQPI